MAFEQIAKSKGIAHRVNHKDSHENSGKESKSERSDLILFFVILSSMPIEGAVLTKLGAISYIGMEFYGRRERAIFAGQP